MEPQPLPRCVRCSKTHSNPHAFLLSCSGDCCKSWHHRCHQPPVSDSELIARIKAFNEGDIENSIHAWMCRRCFKRRNSSRAHHLSTVTVPSSRPVARDPRSTRLRDNTSIQSSGDPVDIVNPSAPESNVTATSTQPVQSLYVKYNLSTSWIQNRHPNLQNTLSLPRLTHKGTSRRVPVSTTPSVAAQELYNFSCISWLRERRESATAMRLLYPS